MEEETKVLLRKVLEVSEENNHMLHKLRRQGVYGMLFRLLWWAVIIGIPIFMYYQFVRPSYEEFSGFYQSARENIQEIQENFSGLRGNNTTAE
jgi:hypothetical protein